MRSYQRALRHAMIAVAILAVVPAANARPAPRQSPSATENMAAIEKKVNELSATVAMNGKHIDTMQTSQDSLMATVWGVIGAVGLAVLGGIWIYGRSVLRRIEAECDRIMKSPVVQDWDLIAVEIGKVKDHSTLNEIKQTITVALLRHAATTLEMTAKNAGYFKKAKIDQYKHLQDLIEASTFVLNLCSGEKRAATQALMIAQAKRTANLSVFGIDELLRYNMGRIIELYRPIDEKLADELEKLSHSL